MILPINLLGAMAGSIGAAVAMGFYSMKHHR